MGNMRSVLRMLWASTVINECTISSGSSALQQSQKRKLCRATQQQDLLHEELQQLDEVCADQ